LALLIGLAIIDDRVRDQIARVFTSRGPSDEFTTLGSRLNAMAMITAQAVRDQSMDHALLVIFAVATAILLVLLTQTVKNQ
jgi:hypothetical protein